MVRSRRLFVAFPAAIIIAAGAALGGSVTAFAASGGDSNRGDVWVDSVGQPSGPGHEMDPHLPCADINLWGASMGDASGTFIIDGWPPSGHMEQDYPASGSATWKYSGGKSAQVIAVISIKTLMANATANGDTAAHEGFHFKLQLSQDPQKHKTFWVECSSSSGVGGTGGGGGVGGGGGTGGTSGTATTHSTGSGGAASAATAARLAQTGAGILPKIALLLGLVFVLGGLLALRSPGLTRR